MDKPTCGVPEERWIDLLLGRLQPNEADSLLRHRAVCPACDETYRQWGELLGRTAAAPVPAEQEMAPQRRRRLRREARRHGFARRAKRAAGGAIRRPAGLAVAGCALALVAFAWLMYGNLRGGQGADALAPERYAARIEPEGAELMSRPDTVVYSMSDGGPDALDGGTAELTRETVWINVRTHEVFLLMEGILPSDDRDVQAWATSDGSDANLGVLQFHQNRAHLYVADVRPELWDSLALTIEPKGGSVRPTAPRTAALLMLRNK